MSFDQTQSLVVQGLVQFLPGICYTSLASFSDEADLHWRYLKQRPSGASKLKVDCVRSLPEPVDFRLRRRHDTARLGSHNAGIGPGVAVKVGKEGMFFNCEALSDHVLIHEDGFRSTAANVLGNLCVGADALRVPSFLVVAPICAFALSDEVRTSVVASVKSFSQAKFRSIVFQDERRTNTTKRGGINFTFTFDRATKAPKMTAKPSEGKYRKRSFMKVPMLNTMFEYKEKEMK